MVNYVRGWTACAYFKISIPIIIISLARSMCRTIFYLFCLWQISFVVSLINNNENNTPADRLLEELTIRVNNADRKETAAMGVYGVHDALSARVFERHFTNKQALFVSGFGITASRLGLPDAGLLTSTEMEDSAKNIIQQTKCPVIVDGDTGFGGVHNIRRTIRQIASIGAAAITIEDQQFPKTCTYLAGSDVTVLDRKESKERIQVALKAKMEASERDGNKLLIVARTDCRMQLGLDEAIERCLVFEELGADIVYAENLQSTEEYTQLRTKIQDTTPMMLAQVQTGKDDQNFWTLQKIGEMGYQMGLFGITGLQAAVTAMDRVASEMLDSGLVPSDNLSSLDEIKDMVGFPELDAFEQDIFRD